MIRRIFNILCQNNSRCWIVDADIKQCFYQISHVHLLGKFVFFPYLAIIAKWLNAGYVEQGTLHETYEGTLRGGE